MYILDIFRYFEYFIRNDTAGCLNRFIHTIYSNNFSLPESSIPSFRKDVKASSIITVNTFIKQKTTINMYRNKNIAPKTGSTSMNM
jgi:hypothetical protein